MNEAEETRCQRCGKRLLRAAPRPAPDTYPLADEAPSAAPAQGAGYQASLFRETSGKVVSIGGGAAAAPAMIPTMAPRRTPTPHAPVQRPAQRRTVRPKADSQQSLNFADSREAYRFHEESICCDAPVAARGHRVFAASVDAAFVLAAVGCVMAVFFLTGGTLVFTRTVLLCLFGVVAGLALFYKFLFSIAGGDSPGMRFAGLRLVDFDGRSPDRRQRITRQVAGLLSISSAALGLLWSLVDEETLTWHDHISKTFPTAL